MQQRFDRLVERASRGLARRTSRRGFLGAFGMALTGSALMPLLPISRGSRAEAAEPGTSAPAGATKPKAPPATTDPNS